MRGGYGMFYNQFERIGSEDQLALNPPGLRNIDVKPPRRARHAVLLLQDGFPPNFLDPSNLVISQPDAARGGSQTRPARRCSSSAAASSGSSARSLSCPPTSSARSTSNLAVLRNINQPLPGTLDANGPRAVPDLRQHPVARDDRRGQLQGRRPRRSRSGSAMATAIARRTPSAKRATRRPSISTPHRAARRTDATSNRGKGRATSTSVIAWSPTSSPSCRSARASRCCRTASRGRSSAAGWSAASTARAPGVRSR